MAKESSIQLKILKKYKNKCLSIDTRKSDLMVKCVKYGANLINDVSGFEYDKQSIKKLKNSIFQKYYIICKVHQKLCKKIQNIKMFY